MDFDPKTTYLEYVKHHRVEISPTATHQLTEISLDNYTGLRLLHLMNQLLPDLIYPNIRLGIYSIGNQQLEGLVDLHRSGELALDDPTIL